MTTRSAFNLAAAVVAIAALVVLIMTTGCAAKAEAKQAQASVGAAEVEGIYTVAGTSLMGEDYTGVLQVVTDGAALDCLWVFQNPADATEFGFAYGYGFVTGPDRFVVTIVSDPNGGGLTVAEYIQGPDGVWHGRWTLAGSGMIAGETLTPTTYEAVKDLVPQQQDHKATPPEGAIVL